MDNQNEWRTAAVVLALLLLGILAYKNWSTIEQRLGFGAATPQRPAAKGAAPASAPPQEWRSAFSQAGQAVLEQRPQDAVRHYREALAFVERTRGADDPLAAVMLERIGEVHTQGRNYPEADAALSRALAILERHSHADTMARSEKLVLGFDRESVLRKLGWAQWELRRYTDSLATYQRAYDTVAELPLSEAERNRRLAYNSAGIMATACTQGQWDRADRAMVELKQRLPRVSPGDRKWLEYWVRTGEPRLAARKC